MNNIQKFVSKNASALQLAACIAAIVLAFEGSKSIEEYFKDLPIEGQAHRPRTNIGQADKKNLPLIFAEALESKKDRSAVELLPVDIDAAFLPQAPAVEEKIVADHFKMLPRALRVGGVSSKGAIIGGEYVAFGSKLESFGYPGLDSKWTVPVLVGREGNFLVVRESSDPKSRTEKVAF